MADRLFQVVHVNIRGLRANQDNLQEYLRRHRYPDVVTINESKLNDNQLFSLPFYDCVATRGSCPHGSLILKRKDILDVTVIEELNQIDAEIVGVRINGNSFRPTINIVTLNNPPNTTVDPSIAQIINQINGKTLLTGDFNCKNTCWGSTRNDVQGESLLRDLNDARLIILNDGNKTRYDPRTGREQALDLMVSNSDMFVHFVSWEVDEDIGSDHFPIRASFSCNNTPLQPQLYRNIKDTDWEKFRLTLQSASLTEPTNAMELDEAVQNLTQLIANAFEAACPQKCNRFPNKTAFSSEMIRIVKEKRRLRRYKAVAKTNGDWAQVADLQREINKKNNELKKHQKIKKKEQIMKRCHELNHEKDSGKFFRLFRSINGKSQQTANSCTISEDGIDASTDQQKADLFARRLERLHKTRNDPAFNQAWKQTIESYIHERKHKFEVDKSEAYSESETGDQIPIMTSISMDEILTQLRRCKNKSAPGSDGLNYLILKKLPPNILQHITKIFNKAFRIGYFPQSWKRANIIMLPKIGKNQKEAKNWRPISLLSCFGKLFERVVANRITQYVESNNLLTPFQSGFRKGRMTTEQLLRLAEDAYNSLKQRQISAALFLDAEAAFDQAWHDAIRYKIDKLGLPDRLTRLVSSFLSDRELTVKFGDKCSKTIQMEAGTPQGSCLSPLLYIILVNDIPRVGSTARIGQFADDIALWVNAHTFKGCLRRLQEAVNVVEGWCRRWRIKLNGTKSNLLFIHRLHEQPTDDLSLQLFNDIIRPTTVAKYLGIEFNNKLSFAEHFLQIEKKATSRLNLFKMLVKNGVENHVLVRLFKTYVRPLFEYGSICFLPADINRLQKIQNEFIRLSLKLPRYIRTSLIHEAAGIELVEKRLIDLNQRLLRKMTELETIRNLVESSRAIVPLNGYQSPLDKLS